MRIAFIFVLLYAAIHLGASVEVSEQEALIDKSSCYHDGYSNGSICFCQEGYTSDNCRQRVCQNDGVQRAPFSDYGCICPPGFLGQNCEPVQCIAQPTNTFGNPSEKVLAAYITYNLDLDRKLNSSQDFPVKALCEAFSQNTDYSKLSVFFAADSNFVTTSRDAVACYSDYRDYLDNFDITTSSLSFSSIQAILNLLTPKSRFYIISNFIPKFGDDINSVKLSTIQTAVSKNIITNSILFEPNGTLILPEEYNERQGYLHLRDISEATLGNFITPYDGADNNLLGTNNVYDSITFLEMLERDSFKVVAVQKSTVVIPTIVNVGQQDFYILLRTSDDLQPYNVVFANPPNNNVKLIDTGYFFAYKSDNTGETTNFALYDLDHSSFNYYVYSKRYLKTNIAVTTSADNVDASAPNGVVGSPQVMVAHVEWSSDSSSSDLVSAQAIGNSVNLISNFAARPACQFSTVLGSVTCSASSSVFISLKDSQGIQSLTPFVCSEAKPTTLQQNEAIFVKPLRTINYRTASGIGAEDDDDVETCTTNDQSLVETYKANRAFSIIARSDRSSNGILNDLFINPKNVIEQMIKYSNTNQQFYKQYFFNLFTDTETQLSQVFPSLPCFVTALMESVDSACDTSCNSDKPFSYTAAIENMFDRMKEDKATYSDVFVVVDSNSNDLGETIMDDTMTVVSDANNLKAKVFFLMMMSDTVSCDATKNDTISHYRNIAIRTGGAFICVPSVEKLQEFFETYYNEITGADIVQQWKSPETAALPVIATHNFHIGDVDSTLYVAADAPFKAFNAYLLGNKANNTSPQLMYQTDNWSLFKFTGVQPDNYRVQVQFVPFGSGASIVVYTSSSDYMANIAFTDSAVNSVASGALKFGSQTPQYPVLSISPSNDNVQSVHLRIADSSGNVIANTTFLKNRECSYQYRWNYNFVCTNKDDIYYFKSIVSYSDRNQSRTSIFSCAQDSECLNGGVYIEGKCECPLGFVGDDCSFRNCQSGHLQSDGSCSCDNGITGDFCEFDPRNCSHNYNNPTPIIRSEIRSVLFVIEPSGVSSDISSVSFTKLNGYQTVVAGCNNNQGVVLGSSTLGDDAKNYIEAANSASTSQDGSCVADALIKAMDTSVTSRTFIVLFVKSANLAISDEQMRLISNRFSSGRFELRLIVSSSDTLSDNLQAIATIGNGIPFIDTSSQASTYLTNYLLPQFNIGQATSLVVVESAQNVRTSDPISVTIYGDSSLTTASSPLIIHYTGDQSILTISSGKKTVVVDSGDSHIVTYAINSNDQFVKITFVSNSVFSYSIERQTVVKSAFGFQIDGQNENLDIGTTTQKNFMSLFFSNGFNAVQSKNIYDMPQLLVSTIYVNGSLGSHVRHLPVVSKNYETCIYPYYTDMSAYAQDYCTPGVRGYKIKFQSLMNSDQELQYQEQKIVTCYNVITLDDCTHHGRTDNQQCSCSIGWQGTDCSYPVCSSTGKSSGRVCQCETGSYGYNCNTNNKQYVAFVIDVNGFNNDLYSASIDAITQYVTSFDMRNLNIMLVGSNLTATSSANSKQFTTFTAAGFQTALAQFTKLRLANGLRQDVSDVVNYIASQPSDNSEASRNVFFFAQQSLLMSDQTGIATLQKKLFSINYIGFGTKYVPYDTTSTSTDDMKSTGILYPVTSNVDALTTMYMITDSSISQTPKPVTPTKQPSCVNKMSASIFLAIDMTYSSDMDSLRKTLNEFVGIFPNDFNRKPNEKNSSICNLDDTTYQWAGKTVVTPFLYYDAVLSSTAFTFCKSYSDVVQSKINTVKSQSTVKFNSVLPYLTYYFSQNCSCSRLKDDNVDKIIVWVPQDAGIQEVDKTYLDNIGNTEFTHVILPYKTPISEFGTSSVYYQLAMKNLDKKFTGKSVTDFFTNPWVSSDTSTTLVQKIYAKLQDLYLESDAC